MKVNSKNWALILFLCFLLIAGCSSSTKKEVTTIKGEKPKLEWTTYSDSELGISFKYPANWKVQDPSKIETNPSPVFVATDPESPKIFTTNINLIVQQHPYLAPSAKDQIEASNEQYDVQSEAMGMKDYKMLSYLPLDIGEIKAGIADSEFIISQNEKNVRNRILVVPKGQKTFNLTMTTDKDSWDKYEPIFKEISESLEFIEE